MASFEVIQPDISPIKDGGIGTGRFILFWHYTPPPHFWSNDSSI